MAKLTQAELEVEDIKSLEREIKRYGDWMDSEAGLNTYHPVYRLVIRETDNLKAQLAERMARITP